MFIKHKTTTSTLNNRIIKYIVNNTNSNYNISKHSFLALTPKVLFLIIISVPLLGNHYKHITHINKMEQ